VTETWEQHALRIGLYIEQFNPSRGGRERSTAQIARELAARGHAVQVVCMAGSQPADRAYEVVPLGTLALSRFVAAAQQEIARRRHDIAHAMFPLPGANIYQLRGGTLPGLRAGHLRRLNPLLRPLRKIIWPLNRLRALLGRLEVQVMADPQTWCLPVSDMVAREIECFYGRTQRVRTIFNAAEIEPASTAAGLDLRRQWGVGREAFVMLCPATNYELKGVLEAAQAFAQFHRRDERGASAYLVVLGCQDDSGYQRVISAMGLAGQVVFLPPAADMAALYAAADAVILLSWYDPCSRVILEAVASGLPAITTRYNGAAEILAEGAGIVVEGPRSRREIAAAMGTLAEPARRADYAEACRRLAARVSVRRHVDELLSVYQEIAGK
jgi:UDP-glucose:(heptosyl)LPS alpha-1,3-glucosyltransferase